MLQHIEEVGFRWRLSDYHSVEEGIYIELIERKTYIVILLLGCKARNK